MHNFSVCLVENFGATRTPRRNAHLMIRFSEISNRIEYLKRALAITCQFVTGKYKLFFVKKSIATQSISCVIFCAPQRDVCCMLQTRAKTFNLELDNNFFKRFSCKDTFLIYFLNEILFLH